MTLKSEVEDFASKEGYQEITIEAIEKSRPKLNTLFQSVMQTEYYSHFNSVLQIEFNPISK